jgi:hypothetical protein
MDSEDKVGGHAIFAVLLKKKPKRGVKWKEKCNKVGRKVYLFGGSGFFLVGVGIRVLRLGQDVWFLLCFKRA